MQSKKPRIPLLDGFQQRGLNEALATSILRESRFHSAFCASGMPKAIVGVDGRLTEANDAFCTLVGFSPKELAGMPWQRLIKHEGKDYSATQGAESGAAFIDGEMTEEKLVHKEGLALVCITTAAQIYDDNGAPLFYLLELQDITERKLAEQRLIESEGWLFDLIEQSPVMYALYDLNGLCVMVNDAWARMWDLPRELIIGRFNVLEDEQIKASGQMPWIRKAFSGETIVIPDAEFDAAQMSVTGGKGRRRCISTTAYPLKDSRNRVCNVAFLSLDITERKVAEVALRDSESRFRLLAENSTDVISRHDAEGVYLYVSPACFSLLGYRPEQLVGRNAFDYMLPDDTANVKEELSLLLESRLPRAVRYRIRKATGEYVWFESISRAIVDQGTGIIELQCASRDISDRVDAQAKEREHDRQLFQATRLATIGTLMSEIGHEINNPNNYIRLNSQNLLALWTDMRSELDAIAKQRADIKFQGIPYGTAVTVVEDLLHGVVEGSRRIESLLLDLRGFILGDDGAIDQGVDLNAAVKSAIVIIDEFVRKSTNSFSFNGATELPRIQGNQYQLEQVVINLVNNACHALDSKDKAVSVETRIDAEGHIALIVRDEGKGISDENLKHLMDPFFTTMRERGGSGLGLAVTARIVRNHGGTMHFSSQVGVGTTVRILFPVKGGSRESA